MTNDRIPDDVADIVRGFPEYRHGAHLVTLVLRDGLQIPDVVLAWGNMVVKVGDSPESPFDVRDVVAAKSQI